MATAKTETAAAVEAEISALQDERATFEDAKIAELQAGRRDFETKLRGLQQRRDEARANEAKAHAADLQAKRAKVGKPAPAAKPAEGGDPK
jgi:uncharacterized MAPEG superfamily protein